MNAGVWLSDPRVPATLPKYLASSVLGDMRVFRTPLFEAKSDLEVLDSFKEIVFNPKASELPDRFVEYEKEQMEVYGPSSPRLPIEELRPKILAYFAEADSDQTQPLADIVCDLLHPSGSDRRLLDPTAAGELLRSSTNAGFPFFTRKGIVREQLVELAQGELEISDYPAIRFNRGTSHGLKPEDVNNRIVWGFPGSTTVREMELLPELQRLTHWHVARSAVKGPLATDLAVNQFIKWSKEHHSVMFSSDFSGFDTSLKPIFLRWIMTQVKPIFQRRFWDRLDFIIESIVNIPLLVGPNEFYEGPHGMPSGTGVTNDFDSIAHRVGQQFLARLLGDINPYSQVQGDDGLLSFVQNPEIEDVVRGWESIGLSDNSEKGNVSYNECIYLRRWYNGENSEGWYPLSRALSSMRFQERWHDPKVWGPKQVLLRYLSILENCASHPLWIPFMEFCISGDKYALGSKGQEFSVDSITTEDVRLAESNAELNPNYSHGRSFTGIRKWRSFQYLKERK